MSYSIQMERLARQKQQAREIVREVLNFGVTEQQKLDIINGIVVSLENNAALKELSEVIKKYRETINKEEETENNNNAKQNKIILE